MTGDSSGPAPTLTTDRLLLRPWRTGEAGVLRALWAERDPRVPPHRRIDADGRPTLAELEEAISSSRSMRRLPAIECPATAEVVGYCGWVAAGPGGAEPELAFELLRRWWGRGCATEAGAAVLELARAEGHERLWASVWDWNAASRRVLIKLGFTETGRETVPSPHGVSLLLTRRL